MQWLEDHWRKVRVGPTCLHLMPGAPEWPTLYIREGQALNWSTSC
jgi:hypothetical protein